jgi:hypothetical protein
LSSSSPTRTIGSLHKRWRWNAIYLLLLDCWLWGLAVGASHVVELPSRRMANMAYVLWVLAAMVMVLLLFLLVDLFRSGGWWWDVRVGQGGGGQ